MHENDIRKYAALAETLLQNDAFKEFLELSGNRAYLEWLNTDPADSVKLAALHAEGRFLIRLTSEIKAAKARGIVLK